MKEKTITSANQRIIELMGLIAKKSEGKGFEEAETIPELSSLKEFLNCSATQALLFSLIIYLTVTDNQPRLLEIARHLKHDPVDLLHRVSDLRALQKRGLIRKQGSYRKEGISDVNFYVPAAIIEALSAENKKSLNPIAIGDVASLFSRFNKLTEQVEEEILNQDELEEELLHILENHPSHYTIKNLHKYRLSIQNKLLLLAAGSEYIKGNSPIELDHLLRTTHSDAADRFRIKRELIRGNHPLLQSELFKLDKSYFKTDRNISLTDKAIKDLFDLDFNAELKLNRADKDIIPPEQIKSRRLYFNEDETVQLAQILNSLSRRSYDKVITELKRNNMTPGIAILFYGDPGTGKTEGAYQMARKLKKAILRVDISQTKNLYFGESEKEIKRIFEKYRELVEKMANCPILLLNEADGILGKRKSVSTSNVAQTENAMQNIILQEMEDLQGIMMATTNLTMNLDRAFERRFLYKVRFDPPEAKVRARIWKEHLKELHTADAKKLSESFAYTGGQISNIARKAISSRIINQRTVPLSEIIQYCEMEPLAREGKRIGY